MGTLGVAKVTVTLLLLLLRWGLLCGCSVQYTSSSSLLESLVWFNATGRLRGAVESMFHAYGVDMYLCG